VYDKIGRGLSPMTLESNEFPSLDLQCERKRKKGKDAFKGGD